MNIASILDAQKGQQWKLNKLVRGIKNSTPDFWRRDHFYKRKGKHAQRARKG